MAELQARISSREFGEWMAYYSLEPWGWDADNFHTALIASVVANTARNPKKHRKPYSIEEFLPQEDTKPRSLNTVDPERQRAALDAIMTAWGGKKH